MSRWTDAGFPDVELLTTYDAMHALAEALSERNLAIYPVYGTVIPYSLISTNVTLQEILYAIKKLAMVENYAPPGRIHNYELWMCDIENGDASGIGKSYGDFREYVLSSFGIDLDGNGLPLRTTAQDVRGMYALINSIRYGFARVWDFYLNERFYHDLVPPDVPYWSEWFMDHYSLSEWFDPFYVELGNVSEYRQRWFADGGFGLSRSRIAVAKGGFAKVVEVENIDGFAEGTFYFGPAHAVGSRFVFNPLDGIEPPAPGKNAKIVFSNPIGILDYSSWFKYYDPPEG